VTGRWVVDRPLEGLVVEVSVNELEGEGHVEGDGDNLENDTAQHDFSTHFWVLVITCGSGSNGTTDTLNGNGDKIGSEEDD
jgi:hypothetical protein